ncbi:MAG: sulfite exporter TauE/SafE family protein [Bacteroidetes bacterium]|nr:sulfite exporter TauE/SafE family protein [Bacteroidota bacterium]
MSITILLFLGTILSFWISAIAGGGASLILIPILNLLLPSTVVPFSLTVGTFTSSASRIVAFKKHIQWKIFLWFVPCSIPAVFAGAQLIKYINPNYIQLAVALFLIANLPQVFPSKKETAKPTQPYTNSKLALIGLFAGFISGITGAIGLLFNRFYLKYGLTKEEIIATRAANEIFLHLIKLITYAFLGLYSSTALYLGLTIASASIISSVSIKSVLPRISDFLFKKIGYSAMVLSGFILLISATNKITIPGNKQPSLANVNTTKKAASNQYFDFKKRVSHKVVTKKHCPHKYTSASPKHTHTS